MDEKNRDRGYLLVRLVVANRGNVIAGLDEGVRQMTLGETALLKVCIYMYICVWKVRSLGVVLLTSAKHDCDPPIDILADTLSMKNCISYSMFNVFTLSRFALIMAMALIAWAQTFHQGRT